jgi:hypothetical protein
MEKRRGELMQVLHSGELWNAKSRYWKWLRGHNMALWFILDPVVSVHPDGVILKCSRAMSRVMAASRFLPKIWKAFGETVFGTTNVDYSKRLTMRCAACAITVPRF